MTANTIVNGDFETGDLTGWSSDAVGTYASAAVATYYKNTGVYGCNVQADSDDPSSSALIGQAITLTEDMLSLQFDIAKSFYSDADPYPTNCFFHVTVYGESIGTNTIYAWEPEAYQAYEESFTTITITYAEIEAIVGSGNMSAITSISFLCGHPAV